MVAFNYEINRIQSLYATEMHWVDMMLTHLLWTNVVTSAIAVVRLSIFFSLVLSKFNRQNNLNKNTFDQLIHTEYFIKCKISVQILMNNLKECQPHTKLYNQICCLLSCSRFRRVCLSLVCIHSLVLLLTLDRGQANDAKQKKLTRLQSFALIKEFQDKRMKYIIFKHLMEIEVKIIRMYKIM